MGNLRINLGCGNFPLKNYINHDIIKHRPEIEIAFDLNQMDWYKEVIYNDKIKIDKIEEIRAYDVVEHLNDPLDFMNNCWELLNKNGVLNLKVCGWKNPNFYVDITHRKAYDINSFDYFDETTALGKEFNYYTNRKWSIIEKHYDRKNNVLIKLKVIK